MSNYIPALLDTGSVINKKTQARFMNQLIRMNWLHSLSAKQVRALASQNKVEGWASEPIQKLIVVLTNKETLVHEKEVHDTTN